MSAWWKKSNNRFFLNVSFTKWYIAVHNYFVFWDRPWLFVDQADLELTQRSISLWFPSSGIKGLCYHWQAVTVFKAGIREKQNAISFQHDNVKAKWKIYSRYEDYPKRELGHGWLQSIANLLPDLWLSSSPFPPPLWKGDGWLRQDETPVTCS